MWSWPSWAWSGKFGPYRWVGSNRRAPRRFPATVVTQQWSYSIILQFLIKEFMWSWPWALGKFGPYQTRISFVSSSLSFFQSLPLSPRLIRAPLHALPPTRIPASPWPSSITSPLTDCKISLPSKESTKTGQTLQQPCAAPPFNPLLAACRGAAPPLSTEVEIETEHIDFSFARIGVRVRFGLFGGFFP